MIKITFRKSSPRNDNGVELFSMIVGTTFRTLPPDGAGIQCLLFCNEQSYVRVYEEKEGLYTAFGRGKGTNQSAMLPTLS